MVDTGTAWGGMAKRLSWGWGWMLAPPGGRRMDTGTAGGEGVDTGTAWGRGLIPSPPSVCGWAGWG